MIIRKRKSLFTLILHFISFTFLYKRHIFLSLLFKVLLWKGDARRASWNFQLEPKFFIYISFNKGIVLIWNFKRYYKWDLYLENCSWFIEFLTLDFYFPLHLFYYLFRYSQTKSSTFKFFSNTFTRLIIRFKQILYFILRDATTCIFNFNNEMLRT